jgi:hypothetical protein
MKNLISLFISLAVMACQDHENTVPSSDYTGNETTYSLQAASQYPINGTITFKERTDGTTTATVELKGTDGDQTFPVHLHLGNLSTPNADIAVLLNAVNASTGKSETIFDKMTNETSITYNQLLNTEACIKIHLAETGVERDIILAAGNIGLSSKQESSSGRSGISTCKSE